MGLTSHNVPAPHPVVELHNDGRVTVTRPPSYKPHRPPRTSSTTPAMSSNIQNESNVRSADDLPPPRDRQGMRSVSPPLAHMTMKRFNYYLTCGAALVFAFYAWRLTLWKAEAGGWWNLVLGRRPPPAQAGGMEGLGGEGQIPIPQMTPGFGGNKAVEDRIGELAEALGMPSKDLASAIAAAVHAHVPPASLSSVAAHQTGYVVACILRVPYLIDEGFASDAVQFLVDPTGAAASDSSASAILPGATKGIKAAFEAAVGMDEPPNDMA